MPRRWRWRSTCPMSRTGSARALGQGRHSARVTHEHPDHEGALVAQGGPPLLQAARLNAGQVPRRCWPQSSWRPAERPGGADRWNWSAGRRPRRVVIPAPSHTPGSQMIYVRLANGQEFLFGDIATFAQSWLETRARSRLVGDHLAGRTAAKSLLAPDDHCAEATGARARGPAGSRSRMGHRPRPTGAGAQRFQSWPG